MPWSQLSILTSNSTELALQEKVLRRTLAASQYSFFRMRALTDYIRGSLQELRQVQWPTRQQAVKLALIVVVFIIVAAAFFGLIDAFLGKVVQLIVA